jgi:hypothetical protein
MAEINASICARYLEFCANTDPGKYIDLYKTLPRSLDALCDLVSQQFVHPWDGSRQPEGRIYQPRANQSVEKMLENLIHFNNAGLVAARTVNERVIAGCRENALLLTSILRYQGIPARARAGWCQYISGQPDQYADHWVTEVWNGEARRWMMVDTKPKKLDSSQSEFKFGGAVWLELRRGQAEAGKYRQKEDWFYVRLNFGHDFNTMLGEGPHYWEAPPLFHREKEQMAEAELTLLDALAALLQQPDENIEQILSLREAHVGLQGMESAWGIFEQTVYK